MKKLIALLCFVVSTTSFAQPAPFSTGFRAPVKTIFTRQGNLIVAEAGNGPNTGRVSIVDRTSGTRRTLIDGLPSAIFTAADTQPSGPSGLALQGTRLYVTIGSGDATVAGPIPSTEIPNPAGPSSPILSSLLELRADRALDLVQGGFVLLRSQHDELKSGATVTLSNSQSENLEIRLVVDFPDVLSVPRPDFPQNSAGSNPFGVALLGQTFYINNASGNMIHRVNGSSFVTLATFPKIANPTPVGPPVIDAVPDSIHMFGNRLYTTLLSGFPFPAGQASLYEIDPNTGAYSTVVSGLTSAIDSARLGSSYLVLEFSGNMLAGQPGRLRYFPAGQAPEIIADGLITPTSMAVDPVSGEVFVTSLGPGMVMRIPIAAAAQPTAVIPVIGSTSGAKGSHFVTSAQLSNPWSFPISGRIVFHPAGSSADSMDPSLSYTLAPFATRSYDDLVDAIGATGMGSADLLAAVGAAPAAVIRISDDASAQNPSVQVPMLDPLLALHAGDSANLVTPENASNWRMNVGLRTLSDGVTLTLKTHSSSGAEMAAVTRSYPPDYFVQMPVSTLLGTAPPANSAISIHVDEGSAFLYGAAVENGGHGMTFQVADGVMP